MRVPEEHENSERYRETPQKHRRNNMITLIALFILVKYQICLDIVQ